MIGVPTALEAVRKNGSEATVAGWPVVCPPDTARRGSQERSGGVAAEPLARPGSQRGETASAAGGIAPCPRFNPGNGPVVDPAEPSTPRSKVKRTADGSAGAKRPVSNPQGHWHRDERHREHPAPPQATQAIKRLLIYGDEGLP